MAAAPLLCIDCNNDEQTFKRATGRADIRSVVDVVSSGNSEQAPDLSLGRTQACPTAFPPPLRGNSRSNHFSSFASLISSCVPMYTGGTIRRCQFHSFFIQNVYDTKRRSFFPEFVTFALSTPFIDSLPTNQHICCGVRAPVYTRAYHLQRGSCCRLIQYVSQPLDV